MPKSAMPPLTIAAETGGAAPSVPVQKIPLGRRAKRPPRDEADGPVDYAFRDCPRQARLDQLTREGRRAIDDGDDPLARLSWYVVLTAPTREMAATLLLEGHGHAVLYPREAKFWRRNRYAKAKAKILKPLAARHLFVGFEAHPNWLQVMGWRCITGVIGVGGRPKSLSYASIRAFMDGETIRTPPSAHRFMPTGREYEVGQRVEVLSGPVRGAIVTVTEIKGRQARALLALENGVTWHIDNPLDNLGAIL